MIRQIAIILTAMICVVGFRPVAAQAPECDPAKVFTLFASLKPTNDKTIDLVTLLGIADKIRAVQASCDGLSWSGDSEIVIGPVKLPDGLYRARVVAEGYFSASMTAMAGKCEARGLSSRYLFTAFKGEAANGAENLLATSGGCRVLITLETVSAPWALTLEAIR